MIGIGDNSMYNRGSKFGIIIKCYELCKIYCYKDFLKSCAYLTFKTVDMAEIKISLQDCPLLKSCSRQIEAIYLQICYKIQWQFLKKRAFSNKTFLGRT